MANNIKVTEITGDIDKMNTAIKETVNLLGDAIKLQGDLNKQMSSAKGLKDVNDKLNKTKTTQNEIEKQGNKLLNQRNTLIAKQSQKLQPLTKEVIRQQEAVKRQNKALREQVNLDAGIKKRAGLFKSMTKSIIAAGAAMISVQAAFRIFSNSIKTIANFEEGMSKVRAVTGALPNDFKALNDNAKLLGETTSKSATQVASLQLEFSKLGFSTKEILNATEATISLSIAAGSDLAGSAVVAASTIRGFGLDASETQRVVDVMAKSFSSSALDLEKFKTSMAIVAPVAKASGKSLEFATAQLSILTDAGLDASTAGTSVRNMFLELNKSGLTWEQGLEKINESQNKNVTALELFGKRGATAALILADNTKKAASLEKAYDGATGSAEKMAKVMEDNLIGDTKKLQSAWEGWILSADKGITKLSRGVVQFATRALGMLNKKTEEQINLRNIDTRSMNASFEALKSTNISQETRLKLIDKINTSYGDYLPNLLDENSTLEDITKAQEASNKAYKTKIIQQAFRKEISDLLQKELEAQEAIVESQINREEANNLLLTSTSKSEKAQLEQSKLVADLNEGLANGIVKNNDKEVESTRDKFRRIAELYNIAFSEIEKSLQENTKKTTDEDDKIVVGRKRRFKKIVEIELAEKQSFDNTTEFQKEGANQRERLLSDTENKQIKMLQERVDRQAEAEQAITDDFLRNQQIKKEVAEAFVDATQDLGNILFDLGQSQRDRELEGTRSNYAAQIAAAEGNNKLQAKLTKDLAREEAKIQREQAESERNQALFNIAINTAQGIAKTIAQFGLPAAVPFIAIASALGLAQTGAVLSQPLPEIPGFFKGTESAPSGLKWVAEKGSELINMPDGRSFLAEKPMVIDTAGGEEILNHVDTTKALNSAIYNDIAVNGNEGIESRLDLMTKKLGNLKQLHLNYDIEGVRIFESQGSFINNYLNKKGSR